MKPNKNLLVGILSTCGIVVLSAVVLVNTDFVNHGINQKGVPDAKSVEQHNGEIILK